MSELLLLDVDAATELHQTMTAVADEIGLDRGAIGRSLAGVERLVGQPADDPDPWLRDLADTLRREAEELARRLRMVIFGGPEINAGLLALDHIRANFATIDNRGGEGGDPDGIVSRGDLAWAVEHLDADAAAAAQWLLDHEDFLRAVETARGNDDYLAAGGTEFGLGGDGDGKFSLADVEAHFTKLDTWATLVPYMAAIDVAAHGGDHDGVMSRNDFESFLDEQDLPPDVRQAAQRVLDDGAYHDTGGGLVSWGTLLDVASFIPIVGDVIDGATALYYLSQGEWEQAAMAGIGLIPIPGVSGGSVRASREVIEEVGETAPRLTREMRETAVDWADGPAASSSPVDAAGLRRSLASESQIGEPHRLIAGEGSEFRLRVADELSLRYGGNPRDWQKMSSAPHVEPDGRIWEVHFYRRRGDDTIYEPKTKFPEAGHFLGWPQ